MSKKYTKSILENEDPPVCYVCGTQNNLQVHHVFAGNPRRKLSEKYGLKVHLCRRHHTESPEGVHFNKDLDLELKKYAQLMAIDEYGWSTKEFIEKFGRSYIGIDGLSETERTIAWPDEENGDIYLF